MVRVICRRLHERRSAATLTFRLSRHSYAKGSRLLLLAALHREFAGGIILRARLQEEGVAEFGHNMFSDGEWGHDDEGVAEGAEEETAGA